MFSITSDSPEHVLLTLNVFPFIVASLIEMIQSSGIGAATMKTITIHIPVVGVGVLTTDHPASSYNRPVFVRAEDGQVFGPGDMVEGQTVESWITASSQYTGAATQPWDSATLNQLERYGVRPINNPVGSTDPNEMKEFFQ